MKVIFNALSKNELGLKSLKGIQKQEDGYDTLVYIVRNHRSILIGQRKHIASNSKKQFQKKIRDYQNLYLNVQKIVSATHSQEINSIFDVETLSLEAKKLAQSLQTLQELKIKRAKQEVKISTNLLNISISLFLISLAVILNSRKSFSFLLIFPSLLKLT